MTRPRAPIAIARRRSAGVGLVTAIFLLVVLAGLAVAIVGITTSQQASANIDLLGARAYQAARAGLDWGIFRQTRNNSCVASSSFALPATSSLSGFAVTVTCRPIGSGAATRWVIEATACNPPAADNTCTPTNNPDYVQRRLEVAL
jgi:MSHA biogenesis protein MshP